MVKKETLYIYEIHHKLFDHCYYVVANTIEEAMAKFGEYWKEDDTSVTVDGITSVSLKHTFETII